MPIRTLDHVNIRTSKIAETCAFYAELLGLKATLPPGARDLTVGAWLCDEAGRPVVHLASTEAAYGDGNEGKPALLGSGAVHHVAFECADYAHMFSELSARGLIERTNEVPSIGLRQIFVTDPNGVLVELNFR